MRACCFGLAVTVLLGCSATPVLTGDEAVSPAAPWSQPEPVPRAKEAAARVRDLERQLEQAEPDLSAVQDQLASLPPSILLPSHKTSDQKIADAGDLQVRKSHVYDRMAEEQPRLIKGFADQLVFDALLAKAASRHDIQVQEGTVGAVLRREKERLRAELTKQWKGQPFGDYFRLRFGMSEASYWRLQRLVLARDLYRSYVIRYLAMREDRVLVRLMAHRDRKVVERVASEARRGAEFKTLALRLSEHPSRRDGGYLSPLSRDDPRPVATPAFRLRAGDLSPIFELRSEGTRYYYLLYCVRRMPGRDLPFAKVRGAIQRELERNPVRSEERKSLYLRLRSRAETPLPKGQER